MTYEPSARVRATALNTASVAFLLAALYHLHAVMWRKVGDGDSPERHGLFVLIDACVAVGLFKRPRFFFWVFGLLGLQQLYSHGGALVREFVHMQRIDWQSLLVLAVVSLALWLLWLDRRSTGTKAR